MKSFFTALFDTVNPSTTTVKIDAFTVGIGGTHEELASKSEYYTNMEQGSRLPDNWSHEIVGIGLGFEPDATFTKMLAMIKGDWELKIGDESFGRIPLWILTQGSGLMLNTQVADPGDTTTGTAVHYGLLGIPDPRAIYALPPDKYHRINGGESLKVTVRWQTAPGASAVDMWIFLWGNLNIT